MRLNTNHANTPNTDTNWLLLFISWIIVVVSVLGSLFFSEVMKFPPCSLCWYQRILLYPLVILFLVGLFPFDKAVIKYSLPLVIPGWFVALYHNLLYVGIIPETITPCSQGISCSEQYIEFFGFISIPLLSLGAYTALVTLLILLKKRTTHE
ncbi:MAG: disulfide bond formation protein B [Fibrobacterales bacterium]